MFQVNVSNFQSIANIEINVTGLTVITAPSHSGKSSLVRAIDALMTARWFHEAYMRSGTTQSKIELITPTSHIEFVRKGSASSYKINETSFSKLGRKVPEELTQTGLGEVQVAESATDTVTILPQIQNQFDGPYQDTIPPAALTQLVGSFTNLAPYQTAQDRAKKLQVETRREIERTQKEQLKTSAIVSFMSSITPEKKYAQLEQVAQLVRDIQTLESSFPAIQAPWKMLIGLQRGKALSPVFEKQYHFYVGTKALLQANLPVVLGSPTVAQAATCCWGLQRTSQQLQGLYPTCVEPSCSLITQIQKVSGGLATFSNQVILAAMVSQVRQGLQPPSCSLRGLSRILGSYTHVVPMTAQASQAALSTLTGLLAAKAQLPTSKLPLYALAKNLTTTALQGVCKQLEQAWASYQQTLSERETAQHTYEDFDHQRHVIAEACDKGLCPLCLSELKAKKPRTKKVSEKTATE